MRYAAQVFRESFLKSAEAGRWASQHSAVGSLWIAVEYIATAAARYMLRSSVTAISKEKSEGVTVRAGEQQSSTM